MRYIIFDLETQNTFQEVESTDVTDLDISVATVYDSETEKYTTATIEDLSPLWPIIEQADALVGYNSNHFDVPLLNKYYPGDLFQIKSIDILEDIRASFGRRVRLDAVAKATLGSKKSADGLQAVRWWREGNIKDIIKYCEQDVKVTKEIFEYALAHNHLLIKDGYKKQEIPIDTSAWKEKADTALTHSMGF